MLLRAVLIAQVAPARRYVCACVCVTDACRFPRRCVDRRWCFIIACVILWLFGVFVMLRLMVFLVLKSVLMMLLRFDLI